MRRAVAWGWPEARVLVIDDDLGRSGSSAEGRQGFQRLVAEVGLDHVGLMLGVEMSRLARSSKDWHQLLEICALFGTLIADLDGIYDPSQYKDRLLLGLKKPLHIAQILPLASSTYRFLLVPVSTLDNIADRPILKWLTMSTAEAFGIEHLGNLRLCMIRYQLLNTVLNRGWRPRRPRPD